jgi:hypothetical protein
MTPETLGAFALVCGLIMPFIISLIRRPGMGSAVSVLITVAVSLVIGTISAVLDGSIDLKDITFDNPEVLLGTATTAFTAATVSYKTWFQSTQLHTNLLVLGSPSAPVVEPPTVWPPESPTP